MVGEGGVVGRFYVGRKCAASAYIWSTVRLNDTIPMNTNPINTPIWNQIQKNAHTCADIRGNIRLNCVQSELFAFRKNLSSAMSQTTYNMFMTPTKRQYHLNADPWSMNQNPIKRPAYITVSSIVNLSLTSTNGVTSPNPNTKLIIFATNVSHPPRINIPPNKLDPMYPEQRMMNGMPPSTMVAPPMIGSIVILSTVPPVKTAAMM